MATRLLDAGAVAEMIGMSRDWIYAEVRADRIPHVRLGRYVRFRAEAIEDWIRERERGKISPTNKAAPRRANVRGHGTGGVISHADAA